MRARVPAEALPAATAVLLAVAQPLSTRLARWSGRGTPEVEQAAATEGPVTPAGGAFVIWAPLFAGSLASAAVVARQAVDGAPEPRAAIGWANAALAGNVAWSLNSQFRRLDEVSVALIVASAGAATAATALAERRPGTPASDAVRRSSGALAGWLSVASAANVETTLNLRRGRPGERRARRRAVGLVAAASVASSVASASVRGNPFHAAAAGWGLGGVAYKAVRQGRPSVAATAAGGLLAVLVTSTATARR